MPVTDFLHISSYKRDALVKHSQMGCKISIERLWWCLLFHFLPSLDLLTWFIALHLLSCQSPFPLFLVGKSYFQVELAASMVVLMSSAPTGQRPIVLLRLTIWELQKMQSTNGQGMVSQKTEFALLSS